MCDMLWIDGQIKMFTASPSVRSASAQHWLAALANNNKIDVIQLEMYLLFIPFLLFNFISKLWYLLLDDVFSSYKLSLHWSNLTTNFYMLYLILRLIIT